MSQTLTKTNAAFSSEIAQQVETLKKWNTEEFMYTPNHHAMLFLSGAKFIDIPASWDPKSVEGVPRTYRAGKKTYIIDLRPAFTLLDRDEDQFFYFYPGELNGFIESCVMACQREFEIASRDLMIFKDLNGARDDWRRKEEEANSRYGRFHYDGMTILQTEVQMAMNVGAKIDTVVVDRMEAIRGAHGDFSITPNSFHWLTGGALMLGVDY